MTHFALLAVILLSSLISWAPAEASIFCIWRKVLPTDEVYYSFLLSSPLQASLRLYHISRSSERALSCAWSDNAAVVEDYFSLCRELTHEFSNHLDDILNVTSTLDADGPCVASVWRAGTGSSRSFHGHIGLSSPPEGYQVQDDRSEGRTLQRAKRSFIVPGTLWCGSGNKAPSYQDLGVFTDTDRCCREHDQCKDTILSFHVQFGVFNSNIFTMSHCDCDQKFHNCLKDAKDSISDVVGYTFFNLLKVHCFEFSHRLQCAQRNWFGMCKKTKLALYAVVHPPTQYESPLQTENNNPSTINTTVPEQLPRSSMSPPLPFSIPAAGHTDPNSMSSPSNALTSVIKISTSSNLNVADGPTKPVSQSRDDLQNILTTRKRFDPKADLTETQLSCSVYKDLDECNTKILPQQRRYGLYNTEATTLYHCNCTSRLFQTFANQTRLSEVQSVLLGHVSPSCFLPQNCTAGGNCTAVLVKAEFPELDLTSGAVMEKQRHLQELSLKTAQRKQRAVRLHRRCLRIVRAKFTKTRKHNKDTHQSAV